MSNIFGDYKLLARESHLRNDKCLWFIFLCSSFAFSFSGFTIDKSKIMDVIRVIVPSLSILTGFSMTSLTLISNSIGVVKDEFIPDTNRVKIEQVFSYFAWSIFFELNVLLFSIVIFFLLSFTSTPAYLILPSIVLKGLTVSFLLCAVSYSLILTIRNIKIFYQFLIVKARMTIED